MKILINVFRSTVHKIPATNQSAKWGTSKTSLSILRISNQVGFWPVISKIWHQCNVNASTTHIRVQYLSPKSNIFDHYKSGDKLLVYKKYIRRIIKKIALKLKITNNKSIFKKKECKFNNNYKKRTNEQIISIQCYKIDLLRQSKKVCKKVLKTRVKRYY